MSIALLLLTLAALCLGIFGWLWLAGGAIRPGWRGWAGKAALQVSVLGLIWGLVKGAPMQAVFMALFPPVALPDAVMLAGFPVFLAEMAWRALPWVLGVLALALLWRGSRPWAPGLAAVALLFAGLWLGEAASLRAMCDGASARGLGQVQRLDLLTSLQSQGAFPWRPAHGLARDPAGAQWIWSYRAMDWQVLPKELAEDGDLPRIDCPQP